MTASPAGKISALRQRLHASLAELHQTLQHSDRHHREHGALYAQWKQRWSEQGDDLTDRLRILDRRLRETLGESIAPPRLNLIVDESHSG